MCWLHGRLSQADVARSGPGPGDRRDGPDGTEGCGSAGAQTASRRWRSTRGRSRTRATGAVVAPIYQTSTYTQDGVGGAARRLRVLPRSANPTRTALEDCLAALEGGARGLAFASGLAAEDTLLRTVLPPGRPRRDPARRVRRHATGCSPGSWPAGASSYAAVRRLRPRRGARRVATPADQGAVVRDADQPAAAASPTSAALGAARARRRRAARGRQHVRLAVPAAAAGARRRRGRALDHEVPRRPLRRGRRRAGRRRRRAGRAAAVPPERDGRGAGPFDCWLVLRGIKTLGVRMDRHCDNAERVAELLAAHPAVAAVLLPRAGRPTPGTRSRPGRCAGSAGWSRSAPARRRAGRARRSASGPGSSPSASRSAGWSR